MKQPPSAYLRRFYYDTVSHHPQIMKFLIELVGGCCIESTAVIVLLEASGFSRVAHFREIGRKFDRWLDVVFLERLL